MAPLRLFVLGPPRLERDGQPVELTLRRALAAVVYLAVTGRPQTRDTLARLLWPDAEDREARGRLRRALHRVTGALGAGGVRSDGDTLSFSSVDVRVDARDFEDLATAGLLAGADVSGPEQTEQLRKSVDLYADDFLAGFALPDCPAWDEWQFLERERLRDLFARVLDRLVETCREEGALEQAIAYARRRLALDPLHEACHRTLMDLLAQDGQQAAALRQFRECRRLLEQDLGVEPEPATAELYEAIRARRLHPTTSRPVVGGSGSVLTDGLLGEAASAPAGDYARVRGTGPPSAARPGGDLPPRGSSGPDLLERAAQLAQLADLMNGAAAGRGVLALLSGEAGAGKTTLVRRFTSTVGCDVRVLAGACDALSTPRALGPLLDIAGVVGGEVERLLAVGGHRDAIFAGFLAELSRGGGTTLAIFEDVHWADEATLDLLRFVGRRLADLPAVVLATYRDDEIGPRHPLRVMMGDLATAATVRRMVIPPLSSDAVAVLARGRDLDPFDLHRRTGGNPFFVTEALAAGGGIPVSVRDAVLARAARLSRGARAALDAAAVIGARVEPWLLDAVAGGTVDDVDDCVDGGMLRAEGDVLLFRHDLARTAILAELPSYRTRPLHGRILAALRTRPVGEVDAARLAHHAEAAGDRAAVLDYAPIAARAAATVGAHRQAAAQYERALRFADHAPPADRAELLARLSDECASVSRYADAIVASEQALSVWREQGDQSKEGETLARLANLLVNAGRNAEAEERVRAAVYVLEALRPAGELAAAYGTFAILRMLDRDYAEAVAWGEKAIQLGERFGRHEAVVRALNAVGSALLLDGDERGRACLERSLTLARQHGMDRHVAAAYANLASVEGELYQFSLADRDLADGVAYCAGRDLDALHGYLLAWQGISHLYQGRWAQATDAAQSVLGQPSPSALSRITALLALGRVRTRRGDPDGAATLDEALKLAIPTGTLQRIGPVRAARAEAAWLADDRAGALVEARAAWDLAVQHRHAWYAGELAYWRWLCGDPELAVAGPPTWTAEPFRHQMQGRWQEAAQHWEALRCPYEAARALAESDDASAMRRALAEFERLGARPMAAAVKRRLREVAARNAAGVGPRRLEPHR